MNNVKFYYSDPYTETKVSALVNNKGDIVGVSDNLGKLKPTPRITICAIFNEETNCIYFGVARCSSKDTFTKQIGRELSFKRALENPYRMIKLPNFITQREDVFFENCKDIEWEVLSMVYPIALK